MRRPMLIPPKSSSTMRISPRRSRERCIPSKWCPMTGFRSGTDLIRVADLNHVEVRAYFDEPEIGKLAAGQPVKSPGTESRTAPGTATSSRPPSPPRRSARAASASASSRWTTPKRTCCRTPMSSSPSPSSNTHTCSRFPVPRCTPTGPKAMSSRVVDGRLRRTPVDTGIVNLDRAEITHGLREDEP